MKYKKGLKTAISGLLIGAVNGILGAGGGMIAVPLLKSEGLDEKKAHANAVAVILPITVLSAFIYLKRGYVSLNDSYPYLLSGVLGSFLGTVILKKISPKLLKKVFGGFMIYAGIRLLIR